MLLNERICAFSFCSKLQTIKFNGSEDQWKNIDGIDDIDISVNFGA